mmetsp:Transcript_117432/g.204512  ORF Transcript_117432/g.204512 Transcript_117432/m.204512 type:complete len:207 (-) Transcript_117432:964-1584(-)
MRSRAPATSLGPWRSVPGVGARIAGLGGSFESAPLAAASRGAPLHDGGWVCGGLHDSDRRATALGSAWTCSVGAAAVPGDCSWDRRSEGVSIGLKGEGLREERYSHVVGTDPGTIVERCVTASEERAVCGWATACSRPTVYGERTTAPWAAHTSFQSLPHSPPASLGCRLDSDASVPEPNSLGLAWPCSSSSAGSSGGAPHRGAGR